MSHAIVHIAALDLRPEPNHRAELKSQLLLGEVVRLGRRSKDRQWRHVRSEEDGYAGWVRTWGLAPISEAAARRWRRSGERVSALFTEVREGPGRGGRIGPLPWNARVLVLGRRGTWRRVQLPGGDAGWVRARDLRPAASTISATRRARSLLGAPYLWGGRTPAGLDCSSLTQLMLLEQGIRAPRDARDQQRWAEKVAGAPQRGDLVFFGNRREAGHVGLVLGPDLYLHCRGTVRFSSLDPANPLYDRELKDQLLGTGRPRRSGRRSRQTSGS